MYDRKAVILVYSAVYYDIQPFQYATHTVSVALIVLSIVFSWHVIKYSSYSILSCIQGNIPLATYIFLTYTLP